MVVNCDVCNQREDARCTAFDPDDPSTTCNGEQPCGPGQPDDCTDGGGTGCCLSGICLGGLHCNQITCLCEGGGGHGGGGGAG